MSTDNIRTTGRRFLISAGCLTLVTVFCLSGCRDGDERGADAKPSADSSAPLFREVSAEKGLRWTHVAGPHDTYPMPQIMGGGCAIFDANNDGRPDVLLVPGVDPAAADQSTESVSTAAVPLFLQSPDGTFRQQPAEDAMVVHGYGMGVTTGDIDNDGNIDVLITTASGPFLFRNLGGGHFEDITENSGIKMARWSSAAAFTDFDRDGWLDLLVINYVDYFPGSICEDGTGRRDYCGPLAFSGTTDRLYRNLGSEGQPAQFKDITISVGLTSAAGKGLGAICTDMTGDGRIDFYVANDMEPNRLWVQQADQSFRDEAELRGCSIGLHGRPQASMGSIWTDLNDDGMSDLYLTHLRGETNTLYQQTDNGLFLDVSGSSGLADGCLDFTGFGTAAIDIDCDGIRDILVVNGRVMRAPLLTPIPATSHWAEYGERNQIYRGRDAGLFQEWNAAGEPFTKAVHVSRGLATGDIDNDGDVDVLVTNVNGPCQLFENVAAKSGHWLSVRVIDGQKMRDAVGAKIRLVCNDRTWHHELLPNCGYQSSHEGRAHFGTGDATQFDFVDVTWPDSAMETERFPGGPTDQQLILRRGDGQLVESNSQRVSNGRKQ
jgi:enediyne biosynthesis protein E4